MSGYISLRRNYSRAPAPGFSLIELMIAMLLGLIVIAGVFSVFLAGQQTYRTNSALGDIQDSSRIAFEMVARDVRDAGLTACGNKNRIANVLNNKDTAWYANWANALHGYEGTDPAVTTGTGEGQRVTGTDSVQVLSAGGMGLSVADTPSGPAANFKLNESTNDLQSGDMIIVCDPDHAAMVQITKQNNSNVVLVHNTGNTVSPGNCSKGLGFPTICDSNANGNPYTFSKNSQIAKLTGSDWYIGNNPANGRSLYRVVLVTNAAGAVSTTAQEMIRNVTDMQIKYLQPPSAAFVPADQVTDWSIVNAVQIELTVESTSQSAGTDAKPLSRTFASTTTVRNRVL